MTDVKWQFPLQEPHWQVFACGVEVIATLHNADYVHM